MSKDLSNDKLSDLCDDKLSKDDNLSKYKININCVNLIKLLEIFVYKLHKDEKPTTNTYIANISGLWSHGEIRQHKPNFITWTLLRLSKNIMIEGDNYSIIDSSLLDNKLLELNYNELYERSQKYFIAIVKQVFDEFKKNKNKYLLNCDIRNKCNLAFKIESNNDYISWSLIYILYHNGYITKHVKSKRGAIEIYKWLFNKNAIFDNELIKQSQINSIKKMSFAECTTKKYLENIKSSENKQFEIIKIIDQYKNKYVKDNKILPYDILVIVNHNDTKKYVYIELDGQQHFDITIFSKTIDKLKKIQNHDMIKTKYVIDNDQLIIRIPYCDNHKLKYIIKTVINENFMNNSGFYTTRPSMYNYLEVTTNIIHNSYLTHT